MMIKLYQKNIQQENLANEKRIINYGIILARSSTKKNILPQFDYDVKLKHNTHVG